MSGTRAFQFAVYELHANCKGLICSPQIPSWSLLLFRPLLHPLPPPTPSFSSCCSSHGLWAPPLSSSFYFLPPTQRVGQSSAAHDFREAHGLGHLLYSAIMLCPWLVSWGYGLWCLCGMEQCEGQGSRKDTSMAYYLGDTWLMLVWTTWHAAPPGAACVSNWTALPYMLLLFICLMMKFAT